MKIPNSLSSKLGRQILITQKNSPQILFGLGVAGVITSTVMACNATLKLSPLLEIAQRDLQTVEDLIDDSRYSDKDRQKDVAIIKVQTAIAIGKLYSPAVIVGVASVGALTQSHLILTRRNAAVTAAYAAVEKGFDQYRARVVEAFGEEVDQEMRYGSEKVTVTDPETGKKKTVKRVGSDVPSVYSKFFDPLNPNWSKDPELNRLFLNCHQNYANDALHARGHLFLNEVYDRLGFPRTKAGAVVGWVISKDYGDNFVDFGVFRGSEAVRDFVNGREASILLDFNVDGVIYDLIGDEGEKLSWQN